MYIYTHTYIYIIKQEYCYVVSKFYFNKHEAINAC